MSTDIIIDKPGKLKMIFEPEDRSNSIEKEVYQFEKPGVALSMYNLDNSIVDFARACFNYGLKFKLASLFIHKEYNS